MCAEIKQKKRRNLYRYINYYFDDPNNHILESILRIFPKLVTVCLVSAYSFIFNQLEIGFTHSSMWDSIKAILIYLGLGLPFFCSMSINHVSQAYDFISVPSLFSVP